MATRKLTLIGGGGVRGPLFVESVIARARQLDITEVVLLDVDERKLRLLGGLSQQLASGHDLRVTTTTHARIALTDADFVVTTIRPGGDRTRASDERIALAHGVLGQETTGPGGFAMACRTIPIILEYAELLSEVSPSAWLFNFTNPAGIVTQALHDRGFTRSVGICDSANLAQHAVAAHCGVAPNDLRPEVYGLNHLSWVRAVRDTYGIDLLQPLLRTPTFRAGTLQRIFPQELVDLVGTWINEYLYYYYYAERAFEAIASEASTRGEEVQERNLQLLDELDTIYASDDPVRALDAYRRYESSRRASYMHYAEPENAPAGERTLGEGSEGYAGVALDIIEAMVGGAPRFTAANVPNAGNLPDLAADDVAEISVVADASGIRPLPIGPVPTLQAGLMRQVKLYERLAVESILTRSRATAISALMSHPLVVSYSRASGLVDAFLAANPETGNTWS
jgi:6-phospho-beta-glucosidase